MSLQLWLVRHARVLAPEGICYGASDLAAAPDATQAAAEQAAQLIPQGLPLFSSPLQRCTALARQLRRLRPDLMPIQTDARLAEMNFGQWEGYPWDEIPKTAFDAWMRDFGQHRFGGAESTQGVIDRVSQFARELQNQGIEQAVCVCHAGSIRALHYWAEYGPQPIRQAKQWPRLDILLGSCLALQIPHTKTEIANASQKPSD